MPDLESKGGVEVTSYHLQWDKGSDGATWFNVIGFSPSSLVLKTTITSEVVGGVTYKFKVRARNVHGWAPEFSESSGIKAAQIPDKMAKLSTSIDAATGGVRIDWVAPHDGYQEITEYSIEIKGSTSSWHEE